MVSEIVGVELRTGTGTPAVGEVPRDVERLDWLSKIP